MNQLKSINESRWLLAFLLPIFCSCYSSSTMSAEPSFVIEELVVTARKRSENMQDVPAAISAFSAEALQNTAAENIVEIENLTPNITINETSGLNPGSIQVFVRGIGNDAGFAQGVGIYVDDVYLNRVSGALLDLYDIERVEVLKGPQGNLYGRNTIGGAIKYISRAPTEETEGSLEVKTGSDSLIKVKGGISGALSDNLLAGVSFSVTNRDGYQTNLFDGGEYASEDKTAIRGTLLWNASTQFL
jgi:iron complex outermembrane receptor protein